MLGVTGILLGEIVRPDIDSFPLQSNWKDLCLFLLRLFWPLNLFFFIMLKSEDGRILKNPAHDVGYPGGIFDPLGMSNGDIESLKVKEIKNGRLTMVAFVGFIAQELVIGKPPLAALQLHLSAPSEHTIFTN